MHGESFQGNFTIPPGDANRDAQGKNQLEAIRSSGRKQAPVTSQVTRHSIWPISKGLMIINHLHVGMAF
jgi:hypothetical protein